MKRRISKKFVNRATIVAKCKDINVMFGLDVYPFYGAYLMMNKIKRKQHRRTIIFTQHKVVRFIETYKYNKINHKHPYERKNSLF